MSAKVSKALRRLALAQHPRPKEPRCFMCYDTGTVVGEWKQAGLPCSCGAVPRG